MVNSFGVVFGCRREKGLEIGLYCPLLVFYSLILIEHLFAINLIEALHCRGGINKHTDMNSKMKEVGAGKSPGRRRNNDQSAQTGSLRRRKVPRTVPESPQDGAGKSLISGADWAPISRRRKCEINEAPEGGSSPALLGAFPAPCRRVCSSRELIQNPGTHRNSYRNPGTHRNSNMNT